MISDEHKKILAAARAEIGNRKLEIQIITEKILAKHNIDPTADFYLKLTMQPYMDLVLERNGNTMLVGHYREENSDLISDPVLALEDISGYWHLVRIEQWCGDTICSYWEGDKRLIYPNRIKEFRSFQRMFARNIREQGWLENGVLVKS
jgi:hypothetical protein